MSEIPLIDGQVDTPIFETPITSPAESPAKPKPPQKTLPKWETDARDRARLAVRRFTKPLQDLLKRDANEGDTRLLVTDFLCEGLGYDKYEDLTTEYQVKGEFADYGVRVDKQLIAFIEVKRCTQKLGVKHLRQVEMYAVNEGLEWMILTNGQVWQAYHLTPGLPVVIDLALEVDLLGESTSSAKADGLFHLSRDALKRRLLDDLWKTKAAISARSLSGALLSESVIDAVRREVRRLTGHNAKEEDIATALRNDVIRPEAWI